jgi:hypothetical protein
MESAAMHSRVATRLAAGLAAGLALACVDNLAFDGEVSPIVVVALLLAATASFAILWGPRAWPATLCAWAWVPLPHLGKRVLGLPDTLHPASYASILGLAAFSLVIASIGTACGLVTRRLARRPREGAAP